MLGAAAAFRGILASIRAALGARRIYRGDFGEGIRAHHHFGGVTAAVLGMHHEGAWGDPDVCKSGFGEILAKILFDLSRVLRALVRGGTTRIAARSQRWKRNGAGEHCGCEGEFSHSLDP